METDKAFDAISPDSAWAFYLQADEVVHERFLPVIRAAMEKYEADQRIEGLVFNYTHFWGSYRFAGDSRQWYRREVRIIRNDKQIRSWLDAQGFRKNGNKLNVAPVAASIFHYGWVKPPAMQQVKQHSFNRYWHDDSWIDRKISKEEEYDYSGMGFLATFGETHPHVMKERIAGQDWVFNPDPLKIKRSMKSILLHFIEKKTGWRVGEYRNYKIIR